MQEEIEEKAVRLAITTTKLSVRTIIAGVKVFRVIRSWCKKVFRKIKRWMMKPFRKKAKPGPEEKDMAFI